MDVYHWLLLLLLFGAIAGWVMAERRVLEPKRKRMTTITVYWDDDAMPKKRPRPSYTMDSNMNVGSDVSKEQMLCATVTTIRQISLASTS